MSYKETNTNPGVLFIMIFKCFSLKDIPASSILMHDWPKVAAAIFTLTAEAWLIRDNMT